MARSLLVRASRALLILQSLKRLNINILVVCGFNSPHRSANEIRTYHLLNEDFCLSSNLRLVRPSKFQPRTSRSNLFSNGGEDLEFEDSKSDPESELPLSPLQEALLAMERVSTESSPSTSWVDSRSSLPFDCTGCGKCCRTRGNVYMSPQESRAAAASLDMTVPDFTQRYASHTITVTDKVNPWLMIDNKESEEYGPGCVFLDDETNQCTIYDVRPVQCSTYPFWNLLMESEYNWNQEVRRKDGDNSPENRKLPEWNPENGGCEGMRLLTEEGDDENENGKPSVPIEEALEQLWLYERQDRLLPRSGKLEPVKPADGF